MALRASPNKREGKEWKRSDQQSYPGFPVKCRWAELLLLCEVWRSSFWIVPQNEKLPGIQAVAYLFVDARLKQFPSNK